MIKVLFTPVELLAKNMNEKKEGNVVRNIAPPPLPPCSCLPSIVGGNSSGASAHHACE